MIDKYWRQNTRLDWKWSLSFPFFSFLEKYIENFDHPKIIGFSGLPGSGKSTLYGVIIGQHKVDNGSIFLNQKEIKRKISDFLYNENMKYFLVY